MDISINRIGSVPYRTVPYATLSYRTVPYRTVPYYSLTKTSHYHYCAVILFNTNVGLWSSYIDYLYNAQGLCLNPRIRAPYDALLCYDREALRPLSATSRRFPWEPRPFYDYRTEERLRQG